MNHYALLNLCSPLSAHPCNLPLQPVKDNIAETEALLLKYIQGDLWVPRNGTNALLGLVSWQHWLIVLAGWRRGLAQDGGIRSLPLIIFSLHSSESWGHSHKIKALPSCLRGVFYTQRSSARHSRLCVVAQSDTPYPTSGCNAATTHSHKWRTVLERAGLLHRCVQTSLRCPEEALWWPIFRWDVEDLFRVISSNLDWLRSI